jgi:hypothetical protein
MTEVLVTRCASQDTTTLTPNPRLTSGAKDLPLLDQCTALESVGYRTHESASIDGVRHVKRRLRSLPPHRPANLGP